MKEDKRPKPKTVVAATLAEERKRTGLTQEQLAEKVYRSTGLIQKYEQGERIPSKGYIDDMAEFFGCIPEYLTGKTCFRTTSEQKEFETSFTPIYANYKAYQEARKLAISGSSFLVELMGFHFEVQQQKDSRFLTTILTSDVGERFEISEPDFMELLEAFAKQSRPIMMNLLHRQQKNKASKKAAPSD